MAWGFLDLLLIIMAWGMGVLAGFGLVRAWNIFRRIMEKLRGVH